MLVTVPAGPELWSAHDESHHHKRRYTEETLRQLMNRPEGGPLYLSHFNVLLFPVVWFVRWMKRLTGQTGAPDDVLPGAFVNRVLRAVFGSERHWVGRLRCPFGVSLVAVAQATGSRHDWRPVGERIA
jgi:hypothetical protein